MKAFFMLSLAAVMVFLAATPLHADNMSLSVTPSAQTVYVGSTFDVTLFVSRFDAKTLGTFDIYLTYNSNVTFKGASFGDPNLGDQLDLMGFGSLQSASGSGPTNLFELSLDDPLFLNANQASNFTLVTLQFYADSLGVTPFDITINAMGDAYGDPLDVTVYNGAGIVVPEPRSVGLLAFVAAVVLWKYSHRPASSSYNHR